MQWTRLQKKIFLLVAGLFTLVFVLTLYSIYAAAHTQAEREFDTRLNVGRNVFLNEINIAREYQDASVETIAKDWALRRAIGQGTEDVESIRSVLFNHASRIKAPLAYVTDNDFNLLAEYHEHAGPPHSFDRTLNEAQQLRAWLTTIDSVPYLMSAEAITAPGPIGWLVMGRPLDMAFLLKVQELISLDISILVNTKSGFNAPLSTSDDAQAIGQVLLDQQEPNGDLASMKMLALPHEEVVLMQFDLAEPGSQGFTVVLHESLSASLQPLNSFLVELIPYFIAGVLMALIGSFYLSRSITRPVGRLLEAAKRIAGGDYRAQIEVSERSELGELAREFRTMQSAVMDREQKIKEQSAQIEQNVTLKHEAALAQKEKQLAEAATKAKSQFLANISHEIRTPLTSIIGYSDMLNDPLLVEHDRQKAVRTVNNAGRHLLSIVNDVLDVSKIEANKIELEHIETDLAALLAELQSYMQVPAQNKGLYFKLDANLPLPSHLVTDPTRLKQILLNLCNNAIKFTSSGGVTLHVHFDRKRQRLIFVVDDTGPGMTEAQQQRLFKAFSQADDSTTRKFGGTGLGLYICKQLSELLGGHIKVTSEVDIGSQFAVYLPFIGTENGGEIADLQALHSQPSQKLDSDSIPQLRGKILCADDNPDNRNLIDYLVGRTGAELVLVEDGEQAVQQAQAGSFDLVLMDMQMPVMDGLDATRMLKQLNCPAPIIMLTANVDTASRQQVKEAGADGHFSKPIDKAKFYQLLASHLQIGKPEVAEEEAPVSDAYQRLVENYRTSLIDKKADIQAANDAKDWSTLAAHIHKMKGAAGSFGFSDLSTVAEQVDRALKREAWDAAQQPLAQLLQLIDSNLEARP